MREDRCQTPIENLKTIALRPPIDLMYAAAAFETAGAQVSLKDYPAEDLNWSQFEADLLRIKPELVVLSCTTVSLEKDLEAAAFVRRLLPQSFIAAKGAHFNVLDTEVLSRTPALTIVLRGEIEATCYELARGEALESIKGITWRDQNGKITRNTDRGFTNNLDEFPFPARHLTNNALYRRPDSGESQTTIVTNRGCPFHCSYCLANQVAGVKNRHRSVSSIITEIQHCITDHGIRNFLFRSELFTQNEKWVLELCEAIIEAKLKISWACNSRVDTLSPRMLQRMKSAGCWIMALGVESGDQGTLDKVGKRAKAAEAFSAVRMLREAGIRSSVYLMIGFPWDTQASIRAQQDFALKLDPDVLEVFYPYPFPGTAMRDYAESKGLIAPGEFPEQAYSKPVMPTETLSLTQLSRMRNMILRRFYCRPKLIARTLWNAKSPSEMFNYIQVGTAQLRSLMAA